MSETPRDSEKCEHCGTPYAYAPQGEYCPNDQCPPYAKAVAEHKKREKLYTQIEMDQAKAATFAAALRLAADCAKRHDQLLIFNFNMVKDEPPLDQQILALLPSDMAAAEAERENLIAAKAAAQVLSWAQFNTNYWMNQDYDARTALRMGCDDALRKMEQSQKPGRSGTGKGK